MRLSALALRYAGALFAAAREANAVDAVESDLGMITWSLGEVPRLEETLTHPLIPAARKKSIAESVFKGKVQDITLHFLRLVVDKRRESILPEVETEYVRLANDFRNVCIVNVTSAVALTDDEKAKLTEKLSRATGKTVRLALAEEPDLVGGLVVQIGDTVTDGSIKGNLASLREKLLGRE